MNKHLLNDLVELNLWNEDMKQDLMAANGSIQDIEGIPDDLKELYKTVWEIPMRNLIDMSADRGAYICQSQSLNLSKEKPVAVEPLSPEELKQILSQSKENEDDDCLMCGS